MSSNSPQNDEGRGFCPHPAPTFAPIPEALEQSTSTSDGFSPVESADLSSWFDQPGEETSGEPLENVYGQGFCEHPIALLGIGADSTTGEVVSEKLYYTSCGNRRHAKCAACSRVYQRDAWHVIQSGLATSDIPALFLTLTAPPMGKPKKNPKSGNGFDDLWCPHHKLVACDCGKNHPEGSSLIGAPCFPDVFDYRRAASWNASSSALFADFMRRWRKARKRAGCTEPIGYLRIGEHHRRGLLHHHLLVRQAHSKELIREALAGARVHADGYEHRYGENCQIKLLTAGDISQRRKLSNYLAKYLCKGISSENTAKGALLTHYTHLRRASVELSIRRKPRCKWQLAHPDEVCTCSPCRQSWAHRNRAWEQLGHAGHVLSKSSAHGAKWGKTLGECREQRSAYNRSAKPSDILYQWEYVSQGYDNSVEGQAKETLSRIYREIQQRPPPVESGAALPAASSKALAPVLPDIPSA
jgi:hypothetical protein